jgi:hypothetical protein
MTTFLDGNLDKSMKIAGEQTSWGWNPDRICLLLFQTANDPKGVAHRNQLPCPEGGFCDVWFPSLLQRGQSYAPATLFHNGRKYSGFWLPLRNEHTEVPPTPSIKKIV